MEDDVPLSEAYRVTAKSWVDAEAAASLLEETKSAVLARMMLAQGDMPVSRAEMNVKASDEWREFIQKMVEAREKAAFLKVKMEYIRMRASERQSMEATKRAEMKL
jgi:hypothetical protein